LGVDNFISRLKSISTKFNGAGSPADTGSQNGKKAAGSNPQAQAAQSDRPRRSKRKRRERIPLQFPGKAAVVKTGQTIGAVGRFHNRQPLLRRILFWLALLGTGTGAGLVYAYWSIDRTLPSTADISGFVRDGTLTIKAADGSTLQQLGPATRDKLPLDQIPDPLVKAFIAAEDRRFYKHSGVDYQSVGRAIASNIVAKDAVEGASTITQQLARLVYLNQERNLGRKVREAFMAQKIDRELSKKQVLEKYLNLVYLGSGAYGVGDAAWVYFSKSVDQLTLSEVATIAGLPPAPSEYSPLVNLKAAQERRNIVLDRMQEEGYITESQAKAAQAEKLKLQPSVPKKLYSDTPYFTSYIQQELRNHVSKEELEIGGLTVETTLNPRWQKKAEDVIKDAVTNIGGAEGFEQAALVSIDPKTGEIRAMVGGTDFKSSQFNRVTQAQRQPGSSFKPIVYATAIATGMSPTDGYLDAPYSIDGYKPQNYSRKFSGWLSLREAITNSVNVISVKLIVDVGFEPVLQTARAMGIKSTLLPTYSLALGASEVNLLEITGAYGTFANKGKHAEVHGIRRILNRKGEVIYTAESRAKPALDPGTAAIMAWMMQNVVNSGTGKAAQLDRPVAGKTGTSENSRDLWFIGFVPQLVTGVWLGNDDNYPTASASTTAAYVWQSFMVTAMQGMPVENFPELPELGGRKGSIKAQPVTPNRVISGSAAAEEPAARPDESRSSSGSGNSNNSAPRSESRDDRPPAEPQPRYAPEAPPEPEPRSNRSDRYDPPPAAPAPAPPAAAPEPPPPSEPAPPAPAPIPPPPVAPSR
jgi:penicillin-binding protein 1A